MDDDVSNELNAAEVAELAALRRRAYSPDADIERDPVALARLAQLEERTRAIRDAGAPPTAPPAADAGPRPGRRRPRLIVAAAAIAAAVGIAALSSLAMNSPTDEALASASPSPVSTAIADHEWGVSYAEGYNDNIKRLRTAALSGHNTAFGDTLGRLAIDQLLPKGTIDGRSVWAGPTIDGAVCLVVGGVDGPFIGCATAESVAAQGLAVIAPPASTDWDTPYPTAPAREGSSNYGPVTYTLLADGNVTTQPFAD